MNRIFRLKFMIYIFFDLFLWIKCISHFIAKICPNIRTNLPHIKNFIPCSYFALRSYLSFLCVTWIFFFAVSLYTSAQSESSNFSEEELQNALNTFMAKPVQDPRDPLVLWLIENDEETMPYLLMLLEPDSPTPPRLRAWLAFYPTLLPKETASVWIPSLVQSLEAPYWRVRANACLSLGKIDAPESFIPLAEALHDSEIWVRNAAQNSIRKILVPQNCKILQQQFDNLDADAQCRVILLLAGCPTSENHTFLAKIASSSNLSSDIKQESITNVVGNVSWYGLHANYAVAADHFGIIKNLSPQSPKYLPQIRDLAMAWLTYTQKKLPDWQTRLDSPDPIIREQTLLWLCHNPTPPDVSTGTIQNLLRDKNIRVRLGTLWFLAMLPPETSTDLLKDFIRDVHTTWPEQITAVTILGMLGDPTVLDFYYQLRSDPRLTEFEHLQLLYGLAGVSHPSAIQNIQKYSKQDTLVGEMAKTLSEGLTIQNGNMLSISNRHYQIYSNIGRNSLHEAVILFESFQYEYRQQFRYLLPNIQSNHVVINSGNEKSDPSCQPDKKNGNHATIYLFRWQNDFHEHIHSTAQQWLFLQDTRAYYIPDKNEIGSYLDENPNELWACLGHELSHQILHQHWDKIPIWLDEGIAELYATQIRITPADWTPQHLQVLHRSLIEGTLTKLEYFVQLDPIGFHNDFGPQEAIHYAQAWSLVQFFHQAHQGQYRQILPEYLTAIQNKQQPKKCWQEILSRHQLTPERLQNEWQAYIFQLLRECNIY